MAWFTVLGQGLIEDEIFDSVQANGLYNDVNAANNACSIVAHEFAEGWREENKEDTVEVATDIENGKRYAVVSIDGWQHSLFQVSEIVEGD